MDHRFQHLGSGNNHFPGLIAALDKLFLNAGQALVFHFDAHIAARDHDTVGISENIVEVIDALDIFDFGYDFYGMTAVIIEEFTQIDDILFTANKGSGDKIDVVFDTEHKVGFILIA